MSAPIRLEIELNLDNYLAPSYTGETIDGEPIGEATTLEALVIGEAARQIAARAVTGATRDAYGGLFDRVQKIRDEELRALLLPSLESAIEASVQRTNTFGEPSGEPPVTLRQVIVEKAEAWLRTPTGDNYNHDRANPVQKIIRDEIAKAMGKELAQAVATAKAEVIAAVQAEGAKVLAQTIAGMARS